MGQSDVCNTWMKTFGDAKSWFEVIAISSHVYERSRKLRWCLSSSKSIAIAMSPLTGENQLPDKLKAGLTVIGRRSPRL